jgi:activating signal cointegrator 1
VEIRCISLMEPWASFVALGLKRIETRGWATRYRGPLGIHASRSRECLKDGYPDKLCERAGLVFRFGPDYPWPLGRILCMTELLDCQRTDLMLMRQSIEPRELALGDFSFTAERKRYGFLLSPPRPLGKGIGSPGALSIWKPSPTVKTMVEECLWFGPALQGPTA